jgi:hypothetical protein
MLTRSWPSLIIVLIVVILILVLSAILMATVVSSFLLVWIVGIGIVVAPVPGQSNAGCSSWSFFQLTIHHSTRHRHPAGGLGYAGPCSRRADRSSLDLDHLDSRNLYSLVRDGRSHHRSDPAEGVPT